MNKILKHQNKIILLLAAIILAYEPIRWLVGTWIDPSYDSTGFLLFLATFFLFIWSVTSENKFPQNNFNRLPFLLILASTLIRLLGQLFAINMIGALTLIIDVYAIAKLLQLDNRIRSISPFWLSVTFAFSLPLERIVQRVMGYGLQNASADGACAILKNTINDVYCEGVRILINNQDVLVDLPCSGARAFLLLLFFYSVICTLINTNKKYATIGLFITILSAYLINILRICVLAILIGFPELAFNIDVMAQPTHDIIGLFLLSLGVLPIILWAKKSPVGKKEKSLPKKLIQDAWWLTPNKFLNGLYAVGIIIIALFVVNIPKKARDVSIKNIEIALPMVISNQFAIDVPLQNQEKIYFTQYGGSAKKAKYGQQNLMIVKTSAPLRHLHSPEDCLRGLGMDVEYRGIYYSPIPTAVYKATDQNGIDYRVSVTFISSKDNFMTTNVSEAVWHWIQNPGETWSAIQRITLWETPKSINDNFDDGIIAALEITTQNQITQQQNGERI